VFTKDSFKNFDNFDLEDDSLFKLAVNNELDLNKSKDQKVKLSTMYQVLSADTSFVGIAKQKNKSGLVEEIKRIQID